VYPLKVEHVTKSYGQDKAVDDLSFTVEPGRVTGFLGPNGAGKSTTMKILLGLASADAGSATIGARNYRDLTDPPRTVGVILEHAYHPARSGRDHLRILAEAAGIPKSRVDEMLDLVGLTKAAGRAAGAYSLGMRQRLGLAAALLGDPPVLVLDEPGNGLDPQGIRELRDLLRARAAAGNTVFVSSHLLAEVEHLADDVIVLHRGRLVTTGKLADLQKAATSVRTPSPELLARILETAGGTVQLLHPGSLLVSGLPITDIGDRAHAAGIALHELSPQAGSLEDLFLGWTGDESSPSTTAPHRTTREVATR
jgi:ABC-2 type transport system ATP-binding protein